MLLGEACPLYPTIARTHSPLQTISRRVFTSRQVQGWFPSAKHDIDTMGSRVVSSSSAAPNSAGSAKSILLVLKISCRREEFCQRNLRRCPIFCGLAMKLEPVTPKLRRLERHRSELMGSRKSSRGPTLPSKSKNYARRYR